MLVTRLSRFASRCCIDCTVSSVVELVSAGAVGTGAGAGAGAGAGVLSTIGACVAPAACGGSCSRLSAKSNVTSSLIAVVVELFVITCVVMSSATFVMR